VSSPVVSAAVTMFTVFKSINIFINKKAPVWIIIKDKNIIVRILGNLGILGVGF